MHQQMKIRRLFSIICIAMSLASCNSISYVLKTVTIVPKIILNTEEVQSVGGASELNSEIALNNSMIAKCTFSPTNNYWNTLVDSLPAHPQSDSWIASIGLFESFHMDFGSEEWDGGPIGILYNVVAITNVGAYPIPPNPL